MYLPHEIERLNQAVDKFAEAMKAKLAEKASQGFDGWHDPRCRKMIENSLRKCSRELLAGDDGQAVDVGNLAMMLWYHKWAREFVAANSKQPG